MAARKPLLILKKNASSEATDSTARTAKVDRGTESRGAYLQYCDEVFQPGKSMNRIRPFAYWEAGTVSEAIGLLAREGSGAYALAGGTDLLARMKLGTLAPRVLVNLKRIAGLNGIVRELGTGLRIGALASISEIERSPLVRAGHRVLAEAAGELGSPSIRNLGTLGGNIGRASPASDMAPSLIVLRARVVVEGARGKREVDIDGFCTAPGKTVLDPGELITGFLLPDMPASSGAAYLRLGRREGTDCCLAGIAVCLTLSENDGGLKDARVWENPPLHRPLPRLPMRFSMP